MKTIKSIQVITLLSNGSVYKTARVKTLRGARLSKSRMNLEYGAHLTGHAVITYTDGTTEQKGLYS